MESTLNFEGKTYQLDLSRLYRFLIAEGVMIEVKPATKPDQPGTGPVFVEPEKPVPDPVVIPTPEPAKPDLAKLAANAIEPVTMLVGIPVKYRLPDTAFSGPVESIDVSDLPAGLSYNSSTRTVSGTPKAPDVRTLTVTAVGAGQMVQTSLVLTIIIDSSQGIPVPDQVKPTKPVPEEKPGKSVIIETGTALRDGKPVTYLIEDNG